MKLTRYLPDSIVLVTLAVAVLCTAISFGAYWE